MEEVRCICPTCFGEGWTLVSAERAKELNEKDLMEDCCPFGDKCKGEDDDDDEEDDDDMPFHNYYICKHCHNFGTDDPDCQKCGNKSCVLLYQAKNSSLALKKAKAM
tara:strand:- start:512 stop:832 length:321 start_codon:yes stop_codon:yes gene_type:complete